MIELSTKGKTPVTILQEYCLAEYGTAPVYKVWISDDAKSPYVTLVWVGEQSFRASAPVKRTSKQLAALEALKIICPEYASSESYFPKTQERKSNWERAIDDEQVAIFDGEAKTPAQVVAEYCNREGLVLDYQANKVETADQKHQFCVSLSVNGLKGEAWAETKKHGKQRAAQFLLKQLYPQMKTWGELLMHLQDEKEDYHKFKHGPNFRVLKTLKDTMLKLYPPDFELNPKPNSTEPMQTLEEQSQRNAVLSFRNTPTTLWAVMNNVRISQPIPSQLSYPAPNNMAFNTTPNNNAFNVAPNNNPPFNTAPNNAFNAAPNNNMAFNSANNAFNTALNDNTSSYFKY